MRESERENGIDADDEAGKENDDAHPQPSLWLTITAVPSVAAICEPQPGAVKNPDIDCDPAGKCGAEIRAQLPSCAMHDAADPDAVPATETAIRAATVATAPRCRTCDTL
jgi:hypothetical protein